MMPNDDKTTDTNTLATSVTVNPPAQPPQQQPVQQVKSPPPEPVAEADQVTVKAIRSFEGVEGFKNPQSQPFTVSKLRAADLFAVGLIEYVNAADEDAQIAADAAAATANATAAVEGRRSKPKA